MSPIADARNLGVMGAFNIIIEALIAAKAIEGGMLAAMLEAQIRKWRETDDPTIREAANVLIHLRSPLVSEEIAMRRALLNDEPKGQA
jgi:hypothetical protein